MNINISIKSAENQGIFFPAVSSRAFNVEIKQANVFLKILLIVLTFLHSLE